MRKQAGLFFLSDMHGQSCLAFSDIAVVVGHASGSTSAEGARCFENWLDVVPQPSANVVAEACAKQSAVQPEDTCVHACNNVYGFRMYLADAKSKCSSMHLLQKSSEDCRCCICLKSLFILELRELGPVHAYKGTIANSLQCCSMTYRMIPSILYVYV